RILQTVRVKLKNDLAARERRGKRLGVSGAGPARDHERKDGGPKHEPLNRVGPRMQRLSLRRRTAWRARNKKGGAEAPPLMLCAERVDLEVHVAHAAHAAARHARGFFFL